MAEVTRIRSMEESLRKMEAQILQMQQLKDNFMDAARQLMARPQWIADETLQRYNEQTEQLFENLEQRMASLTDMLRDRNSGHHTPATTGNPWILEASSNLGADWGKRDRDLGILYTPLEETNQDFRNQSYSLNLDAMTTATIIHSPSPEQFESMHKKRRFNNQIELSLFKGLSLDEKQKELPHSKPSVLFVWNSLSHLKNTSREISRMKSMNEDRYLCISNGLAVLCLDVHQNSKRDQLMECSDEIERLPIKSMLILPAEDFPVSMGMFNLGSDAYMVGGHKFPASFGRSLKIPGDLTDFFYGRSTFEGKASLETYSLSLVEGSQCSLSLSRCDTIEPLNEPKFWPTVEKVGGQLHVFESFPSFWQYPRPPITPSHEVLEDRFWTKLSCFPRTQGTDSSKREIWCSLVVGDRIYSRRWGEVFEVFDSTTQKWEQHAYEDRDGYLPSLHSIKHIAELLLIGCGRCIGEYKHVDYDPLYVVIGVAEVDGRCCAAAHLVTRTGQVVCYQRLPCLVGSFARRFHTMGTGTIISFGDEGETYCAIIPGCVGSPTEHFLFIFTFTVEDSFFDHLEIPRSLLSKGIKEGDIDGFSYEVVETQFVNLVVKDRHMFQSLYGIVGEFNPDQLRACFLQSSVQSSS